MILPADNAKLFVDQIFRIFDKDGNGSIDFKVFKISSRRKDDRNDFTSHICFKSNNYIIILIQEFMMATDMTASGSPEEKLRYRKCFLISFDYQNCYIFMQI